jgi:hypothetical protein
LNTETAGSSRKKPGNKKSGNGSFWRKIVAALCRTQAPSRPFPAVSLLNELMYAGV